MSVIGSTVLAPAEGLWDSGWRGLCGGGGAGAAGADSADSGRGPRELLPETKSRALLLCRVSPVYLCRVTQR